MKVLGHEVGFQAVVEEPVLLRQPRDEVRDRVALNTRVRHRDTQADEASHVVAPLVEAFVHGCNGDWITLLHDTVERIRTVCLRTWASIDQGLVEDVRDRHVGHVQEGALDVVGHGVHDVAAHIALRLKGRC